MGVAAAILLGSLSLTTEVAFAVQFCNPTRIVGTSGTGPSSVYPATINVAGLSGTITDVNVTLLDVRTRGDNNSPAQHWAEDIDVMVSAPDSANVILMSDAGGNNDISAGPVVDADLTFDDQAPSQLPADTGPLGTGTWRPVDDDADEGEATPIDAWAAPAPTSSHSTALSTFNGRAPNGTWSLWVVDDTLQAATDINGGWCVDILTTRRGDERPADFDGNGTSDVSVYRPSNGLWYVQSPFSVVQWGAAGDIPVPGDYDGNGTVEHAVYRPSTGVWYLLGTSPRSVVWGAAGDVPVPADYDGNGRTDVAVFRPSNGLWYIQTPFKTVQWGQNGDIPVPGDYDNNGSAEPAVYRPSTGTWYLLSTTPAAAVWGVAGDIPVPGDYDGNGSTDIAVFRPTGGLWYVRSPFSVISGWGQPGDVPVPGDYDGNGRVDPATYRPSNRVWYLRTPSPVFTAWGAAGDIPLPLPQAIYRRFF